MSLLKERALKFETLQIHAGQYEADPATGARVTPIYQTSSYIFDSFKDAAEKFSLATEGYTYSRINNPTQTAFEDRVAALEGGTGALAVSSGAAAIAIAIENIVKSGEHIVAAKQLYGGTYNFFKHGLPRQGIETDFADANSPEQFRAAIKENTRAVFIESMGNPNSDVADIEEIAKIAHEHKIPLIVDNTFATPYLLRPFDYGADVVIHSATKFIGGHGSSIGGVIVDSGKFDWEASGKFSELTQPNPSYHGVRFTEAFPDTAYIIKARATLLRDKGSSISPFNAFLFLQSLETLSYRVKEHVKNTLAVIEYLKTKPQVLKITHPSLPEHPSHRAYKKYFPNGAGSVFTFEIAGGQKNAQKFIDNLKLFSLLANVADSKSLVIHPFTTTHSQLSKEELLDSGITPSTIRLSIGTEHIDDILFDLEEAFKAIE